MTYFQLFARFFCGEEILALPGNSGELKREKETKTGKTAPLLKRNLVSCYPQPMFDPENSWQNWLNNIFLKILRSQVTHILGSFLFKLHVFICLQISNQNYKVYTDFCLKTTLYTSSQYLPVSILIANRELSGQQEIKLRKIKLAGRRGQRSR